MVVACGVADRRQPPGQQVGVRCALAGIIWYQRMLAVRLTLFGVSCRFVPTCSRYAHAVIGEHGLWTGTWRAAGTSWRCRHPANSRHLARRHIAVDGGRAVPDPHFWRDPLRVGPAVDEIAAASGKLLASLKTPGR